MLGYYSLSPFQNMTKIVLEEVVKELELVKVIVTSRNWWPW